MPSGRISGKGSYMQKKSAHSWAEPFKIKMVELLKMTTREQRKWPSKKQGTTRFAEVRRRIYRFTHRQWHKCHERRVMGRHDDGR